MSRTKGTPSFVAGLLARCNHSPRVVLDLSPSLQTLELAKRLPQSLIIGLIMPGSDLPRILAEQKGLEAQSVENINFACGRQNGLPFEDGTFDFVVFTDRTSQFLGSMEDSECIFAEMYRVLAIGGDGFIYLLLGEGQAKRAGSHVIRKDALEKRLDVLLDLIALGDNVSIERKELNLLIAFKRIK